MALQTNGYFVEENVINGFHQEGLVEEEHVNSNQSLIFKPKHKSSGIFSNYLNFTLLFWKCDQKGMYTFPYDPLQ